MSTPGAAESVNAQRQGSTFRKAGSLGANRFRNRLMSLIALGNASAGDQACRTDTCGFEYNLSMIRHKFSPSLLITLGSCLYAQGLKPG